MNDIRHDQVGRDLGRGAAKEDVAAKVVRIVLAALAVNLRALEETGMRNQVHRHAAGAVGAKHGVALQCVAKLHLEALDHASSADAGQDAAVGGKYQHRFGAGSFERGRQRAHHVGESADLGPRGDFRRNYRNFHREDRPIPQELSTQVCHRHAKNAHGYWMPRVSRAHPQAKPPPVARAQIACIKSADCTPSTAALSCSAEFSGGTGLI